MQWFLVLDSTLFYQNVAEECFSSQVGNPQARLSNGASIKELESKTFSKKDFSVRVTLQMSLE